MKSQSAILAIDVGASKIAGALVSETFKILHLANSSSRSALYGDADPD